MNTILWLILDNLRETCNNRECCEGCPCAGEYTGPSGTIYYCAIDGEPSQWQTDTIRNNLENRAESEGISRAR